MSKKFSGNGLWESSRMILPEHKEAIQAWRRRQDQRNRPELDDQEWERIGATLTWSMRSRKPVTVRVYDPYEERVIVGVVERVDRLLRRVMIADEWVSMGYITGVEIPGE